MRFRSFVLAALALLSFAGSGWSQAAYFDAAVLTRDCERGLCVSALKPVLATLTARSLSPEELNSQIALLAAIFIEAAKSGDPSILADIVAALLLLASYSTDLAQQAALRQLALALSRGELGLFDTSTPFAVSPS